MNESFNVHEQYTHAYRIDSCLFPLKENIIPSRAKCVGDMTRIVFFLKIYMSI